MLLLCAVPGFVTANHFDYPPAQVTVAFLGGITALGWGVRALHRRRA
jgi:hypothetical protein